MKSQTAHHTRILSILLSILITTGCSDTGQEDSDADQITQELTAISVQFHSPASPNPQGVLPPKGLAGDRGENGNDNDDDGGGGGPMLPSQARTIIRAHAIAEAHPEAAGENAKFPQLAKTESFQRLLKKAHNSLKEAVSEAKGALQEFSNRTAEEQRVLAIEAERVLMAITMDFEMSAAAHAVEKFNRAKVGLAVFHSDLASTLMDSSRIPADMFAMVPPPHLEKAVENLRSRYNRLRALESIINDGTRTTEIQALKEQLAALESAIVSEHRAKFQKERGGIFAKIDKAKWAEVGATRDARVAAKQVTSLTVLEATTGLRELLLSSIQPRGPPDTLALSSTREFDLDPTGWCKAEAQLAALDESLRTDPTVPDTLRTPGIDPVERIASTLEDGTLACIERLTRQLIKTDDVKIPSDYLFTEKNNHLSKWAQAAKKEMNRRKAGGVKVTISSEQFESPTSALNKRVDGHLVHVIHARFPSQAITPPVLRAELTRITSETVRDYAKIVTDSLQRYSDISRKIILANGVTSDEVAKAHDSGKKSVEVLATEVNALVKTAEQAGVDVQSEKKALLLASALFYRGPPPEDPGTSDAPAKLPIEPAGPSGSNGATAHSILTLFADANTKINRYQPKIEKHLISLAQARTQMEAKLATLNRATDGLSGSQPEPIGGQKGRITATETEIRSANFNAKVLARDDSQSRLPDKLKDWIGRFNKKTEQPFSFADVKNPTSFEALGGGIHFGETAQFDGKDDLIHAVLLYEKDKGLLIRDGNSGTEWIVDSKVDLTSLRALYRFAASKRNAAISIGWGQERESFQEVLGNAKSGESAVLLDPFLVDTAVGQDLIIADTIPWDLDTLSDLNNQPVPFRKEFEAAKAAYPEIGRRQIERWMEKLTPVEAKDAKSLFASLESADPSPLALAAFKFDSLGPEVIEWVTEREIEEFLRTEAAAFPVVPSRDEHPMSARDRLKSRLMQKYANALIESVPASKQRHIDASKLAEVANTEAEKAMKEFQDRIRLQAEKIYKTGLAQTRMTLLQAMVIESVASANKPNRKLVAAWAALNLGEGKKPSEVASALLLFLNATTLAVLHDDHVTFELQDKTVSFKAQMRYRYATTRIEITDERIGLGRDINGSEVVTLPDLTTLVNKHLTELTKGFPTLARVERYAALAAFFRWADAAVKSGKLGLIDLSGLATAPANDRTNYPTVDVLKR